MKITDLLNEIRFAKLNIDVIGDQLKIVILENKPSDKLLEKIKQYKTELIDFLKTRHDIEILPAPTSDYYPASSEQKRLYALYKLDTENTAYNLVLSYLLKGEISKEKIEEIFQQLIKRHESFRTSLLLVNGELIQKIEEEVTFEIEYHDHNEIDLEYFLNNFSRPFDLHNAPLLRVGLYKKEQERYVMLIDMHHSISDGVSMGILMKDFRMIYDQLELPNQTLHYKDYSVWKQNQISNNLLQRDKDFWLEQFKDEIPILDLPTDYKRSTIIDYKGGVEVIKLNKEVTAAIHKKCKEKKITKYLFLFSAFKVLLSKYSNQEDIIAGTINAGRDRDELKNIVGMFAKTLAIRSVPSGSKRFIDFVNELKEVCFKAFEHQHYPLEELVGELNVERTIGRNPLFDVLFVYQNMDRESLSIGDSEIEYLPIEHGFSKFDISISAFEIDNEIIFEFEYRTNLFARETISRMGKQFCHILTTLSENIDLLIKDIDLTPYQERLDQAKMFNQKASSIDHQGKTVIDVLNDQVRKTPDNIALVYENYKISYLEFSKNVDVLASFLLSEGIKKGDIISVIGYRSPELVTALYGIIKVAAAYLPIEPFSPKERIEYMLRDSNSNYVLFHSEFEGLIPKGIKKASFNQILNSGKKINIDNLPAPTDLAYMIYTSGSTGKPKGVLINHSSLTNFLFALNRLYPCNEEGGFLFKSSYAFDFSVSEIFGWAFNGGKLVIMKNGDEASPNEIEKIIIKHRVSHVNFVSSMFNALLNSIKKENIANYNSIKYFMVGGEAFSTDLVEKYNSLNLKANLLNVYGPTEATIYVTHFSVKDWEPNTKLPIGKPIDNVEIYILDEYMKIQSVGIVGEIYIGGSALARGYMNQPELSEEKFIKDPYNCDQFLYKTGDLGRWLPCGSIEYFGRIDSQVKIRGYRIELGEIESILESHEAVNKAVVVIKELESFKYLCGYLVLNRNLDVLVLKTFLEDKVPSYMVPDFLLQIEEIPVLTNGKIDNKNLPNPTIKQHQINENFQSPSNTIEKKILKIWSENLGIGKEQISTDTSYFEMGGNSIRLISLLSNINKVFNVDISLKDLYVYKNIKSISNFVGSLNDNKQNRFPKIHHDSKDLDKPFPLSNIQFAYFIGREDQLELGNVSTHGFWQMEVDVDIEKVNNCANILIERHHALRTVITEDGQQVILDKKRYEINLRDVSHLAKIEQEKISSGISKRMSNTNFDVSKWPLFEICALKVDVSKYICFVCFDAIIADAYSIELIKNEFKYLYNNTGKSLNRLEVTFRDYIIALNKLKESSYYQNDRNFWLNKLANFPNPPSLPLKQNLIDVKKPNFKSIRKTFTIYESNLIKNVCKKKNVSISTFLLTLYAEVLGYWSNQSDLAINLTFFNRLPFHESINNIVGDFTSLILLDVSLKEKESFDKRVTAVQESLIEALDHRLYDGVEFIREISKARNLTKKAVMPVVFTSALFDTALNFSEIDDNSLSFNRDRVNIENGTPTSQVYLDNAVAEHNGKIYTIWNYVEDLFSVEDINNMFDVYIAKVYDLISETTDYTKAFKNQVYKLYESYNNTNKEDLSAAASIHELISRQCQYSPDSIAVSLGSQTLTYRELDKQSNKVANYLIKEGIQKSEAVCVLGERKIETIINILGVLKVGAVYVPLNLENPINRNKKIQRDCNSRILLDSKKYQSDINDMYSNVFEFIKVNPDDTAYIIFTSGSTGTPKGVVISHMSAINTILDINNRFNVGVNDRILQISSFSFDLSIYDIFGSLVSGAQLVMLKTNKSVEEIVKTLIEAKITIFNAVPSFWKLVVENLPFGESLKNLRHVLLSGDWIPIALANQTIEKFPKLLLTSLGGATEGSIWSIYYSINKINPDWKSIPYGYPLRNQQFYVLNFENELCPIGVKGMLYIGGAGITKGYLNDQIKTEESLLEHDTYGMLYKTGDYGVMHSEGFIEFLGREDDQVKIKGYRIELGEIEKNLNSIDGVKDSLITIHRNKNRDAIVAYVIEEKVEQNQEEVLLINPAKHLEFNMEQNDQIKFVDDIKESLKKDLPLYMIPNYILLIEKFPLNQNGKINRKLLPLPDFKSKLEFVAPEGTIEIQLFELTSSMLDNSEISTTDDFFEVGGDSLKAMSFIAQVNTIFKININISDFFSHPTIQELGIYIKSIQKIDENEMGGNIENYQGLVI